MAVGMCLQAPGMSSEVYDAIVKELNWGARGYPPGFISHHAGPTDDGWFVFDVWESQADFERFAQGQLMEAMKAATGGEPPPMEPQFIPIHRVDRAED